MQLWQRHVQVFDHIVSDTDGTGFNKGWHWSPVDTVYSSQLRVCGESWHKWGSNTWICVWPTYESHGRHIHTHTDTHTPQHWYAVHTVSHSTHLTHVLRLKIRAGRQNRLHWYHNTVIIRFTVKLSQTFFCPEVCFVQIFHKMFQCIHLESNIRLFSFSRTRDDRCIQTVVTFTPVSYFLIGYFWFSFKSFTILDNVYRQRILSPSPSTNYSFEHSLQVDSLMQSR